MVTRRDGTTRGSGIIIEGKVTCKGGFTRGGGATRRNGVTRGGVPTQGVEVTRGGGIIRVVWEPVSFSITGTGE